MNEGELLDDDDAISLTSSDPVAGALLSYAQEEQEMSEGEEAEAEPLNPPALRMTSYWRLWNAPRQSGPKWWRRGVVSMSVIFLAIVPQLE